METVIDAIKHLWTDHRKVCIGAGVVIDILLLSAL